MPKISFIVPVYGVEKYIHQCVDSILGQTYTDFELILVDDGSPDNCPQICDEYAAKDARVTVIHKKNAGVSEARNTGIDAASGEWAYFVDSDDWIELDACEKLMRDAEQTGADCIMSDCVIMADTYQKRLHQFSQIFFTDDPETIQSIQKYVLCHKFSPYYVKGLSNGYAAPWGKFVKLSIIKDNHIRFDPYAKGVFDDGVYSLYLLNHVKKFYYNDEHTYNYRIVGSSLTHAFKPVSVDILKRNSELVRRFIAETGKDHTFVVAEANREVAFLTSQLSKYFFNPKNPKTRSERYAELKKTLGEEPFSSAIRNCEIKYLEDQHKYSAVCMKAKFLFGLELYAKLKMRFR
ncbi:MAG: glycosyltransferase [Clostridiales bacterium]|nr:glycosyltransferase [Clostridiales bacterium]